MNKLKVNLFLLIALLFSFNAFGQNYIGKAKEIDKILLNIKNFSQYYMSGDAESLANCYTSDGKIFPNNANILEGKTMLKKFWTLPEGLKVLHHKVTPSELRIEKGFCYDYGFYEGSTENASGEKSSWQGKYVIVWKKVGKEWKIYLDCWNSISDENWKK